MSITSVFWIVGMLFLLYFPVLCVDSRRWNPTFSSFWIAAGVLCFLIGGLCRSGSKESQILLLGAGIILVIFLYIERRILLYTQICAPESLEYLIILGARVNGRTPSAALMRRIRCAESYLKRNVLTKVIVSGGQGPGELMTEARAMQEVLIRAGIPSERILLEDKSSTTEENLRFSGNFFDRRDTSVGIVTNDFHIYRSLKLAKDLGYRNCYGVPAESELVSLPNYLVREFFAVIKEYIFQGKRRNRG